jgi:hypothetical protein
MATAEKKDAAATEPATKQETTTAQAASAAPAGKKESEYSVSELAANAKKLFGKRPECVTAALTFAGKTTCTVSDAKKIVEDFMKKEVK